MPSNHVSDNQGRRDDKGKPEFHLIPSDALRELGQVFTFGAGKYAPYNWERGMAWSRCYNSLLRHLYAYWDGERNDPETGLHHMAHCAWNALALLVYSIRGIGVDDRKAGENSQVSREVIKENTAATTSELSLEEAAPLMKKQGMVAMDSILNRDDRLAEIQRPQPVGSIVEVREGLKFKAFGSHIVWTVSKLIMSSLNTFQAKDEFGNEQMFHLRAISEIVP